MNQLMIWMAEHPDVRIYMVYEPGSDTYIFELSKFINSVPIRLKHAFRPNELTGGLTFILDLLYDEFERRFKQTIFMEEE